MFSRTFVAALGLVATAHAHFQIQSPAPIPNSAPKDPLDPSGSNFPCHGADLTQGTVTNLAAGSTIPIQFNLGTNGENTAVHGGGSCQISLTYETDPTKLKNPASWKVIKSFVGGCPTDAKGNLIQSTMCVGSATGSCVNNLGFAVPPEVQNGAAILAWTWFNNVGNREMYMNCAKVSVSGGQGKISSLPSMFVANLASINQCRTTEDTNLDFPNPGSYVQKDPTPNYPFQAPAGSGCGSGSGSANVVSTPASSGSSGAAAAGSSSSGSAAANNGQSTGASASAPKASSSPKAVTGSGNPGGVFAQGAAGAATTLATSIIAATATPSPTAQAVSSSPQAGTASPAVSSGSCLNGAIPCTAEGFYCIDALHFGQCAFGCAIPMQMAAGTNCINNAVAFAAVKAKRSPHAHRHLAKRIAYDTL